MATLRLPTAVAGVLLLFLAPAVPFVSTAEARTERNIARGAGHAPHRGVYEALFAKGRAKLDLPYWQEIMARQEGLAVHVQPEVRFAGDRVGGRRCAQPYHHRNADGTEARFRMLRPPVLLARITC